MKVNKIDTPQPKKTKKYRESLNTSSSKFKRWYTKLPIVIALLIVFFPVGLAFMWKFAKWSKKAKWIITVIIVLIVTVSFIGSYNSTPTINLNNIENSKISTDNAEYELSGDVVSIKAAKLTINNEPLTLASDSKFSYKVTLNEGDNTFSLVATNDNGEAKETITIYRTTQAEFAARAEADRLAAEKKAEELKVEDAKTTQQKAEADAKATDDAQTQADTQVQQKANIDSANNNAFYINNAYFKGDGRYDVVIYSSTKDTLQIYVNDENPLKAKVNDEGWATFKKVKLSERSKLSFAKKVGWFKYNPVNYVKYISVNNEQINLIDADAAAGLDKAEADARAVADAQAQAEALAQKKAYIEGLATTYCSKHSGWRNIYVPQGTSRDEWENPNEKLVTKYPKQSNCVAIMTFFVDTMPSEYIDNIINAQVATGMNKAEVLASWGWPNNNSNFSSDFGSSGTWMWDTGTCYYGVCPHQQYANFFNGIVDSTGKY